jgi:molybdopterin-guanine dinucleotide biosynthesis protein A
VVLAGGKSSRMGVDKALLPFRNHTLLQHQYEKIVTVLGKNNVVVSGDYPPYKHVVDRDSGIGPLGGIASVIKEYRVVKYFLFLPVDMPNLSGKMLLRLIQAAQTDSSFDCWSYCNFEMPLIIKYSERLEPILSDLLLQPRKLRSIRNFIQIMKYRSIISEVDAREFLNVNTMTDWNEVINEHTHGV